MNTRARIATVCQAEHFFSSAEQNRDYVLSLLKSALNQKPDLVCLPENCVSVSVPGPAQTYGEEVPGPTTDAVAALAKNYSAYVICPLTTFRDSVAYNSAVVIDRQGQIAGFYDKRCPVTTTPSYTEFDRGARPGREDGIFDLDFGRIGIRICFDIGFPEDWALLASRGARMVFWPSAYNGGAPLTAYAILNGYYVVTSVRTDKSKIIDPCGTTLAQTDRLFNVIVRDINLDFALCHYDFNHPIPDRILADYPGRVEIRSDRDSGKFLIEPIDPTVTIEQLAQKYGFETADQYHNRHRAAYRVCASGNQPEPQQAAHGNRSQWSKS